MFVVSAGFWWAGIIPWWAGLTCDYLLAAGGDLGLRHAGRRLGRQSRRYKHTPAPTNTFSPVQSRFNLVQNRFRTLSIRFGPVQHSSAPLRLPGSVPFSSQEEKST